jgi:hypothetical protein
MMQEQTPQFRLPDHALTLERAAALVGGHAELATRLKVSRWQLDYWIGEISTPPETVFFDAIDIIIEKRRSPESNSLVRCGHVRDFST